MSKPATLSDEALMSSLQTGDESAFNELYDRYSQRILYYMYKMLRQDEARAQDFLQDVFLKVVEAADTFDTSKSFKTWVFTIAANHCKNHFRRQGKHLIPINGTDGTGEPSNPSTEIKISGHEIINRIDDKLFLDELNKALDDLIIPYKEAFILRYSEGLKLSEIAVVMDCPLGTVKSRLNSATGILATKLSAYKPGKDEQSKVQ